MKSAVPANKMFEDMEDFFGGRDITAINFMVVLGQIMNEIRDNIKNEISSTATKAIFTLDGKKYPTYVINFSSPGLTKPVLKNIAARNPDVDFVVSWFYNHNYGKFDVTLSTDHMNRSKLDMNQIAQKLARKMGGSGGGHKNSAHITFSGKVTDIAKFIT